MAKELICISCPRGCHLSVSDDLVVTGNSCKRGVEYGVSEVTNPVRNISSTVIIRNGTVCMLPVRTKEPIKKDLIFKCMEEINKVQVEAPVNVGDVIIANVLGSGVDIVAARTIERK